MAVVKVVMPSAVMVESAVWTQIMAIAKKAEAHWKMIAPYDSASKHPQHYRDSIHTVVIREGGHMKARVYTKDFKAHWLEYGTSRMAARHPMEDTRHWLENGGI